MKTSSNMRRIEKHQTCSVQCDNANNQNFSEEVHVFHPLSGWLGGRIRHQLRNMNLLHPFSRATVPPMLLPKIVHANPVSMRGLKRSLGFHGSSEFLLPSSTNLEFAGIECA